MIKIKCPKCYKTTLHITESEFHNIGIDVFCDECHLYFGWNELSKYWNIDMGDFYDTKVDIMSIFPPEPEWEDFEKFMASRGIKVGLRVSAGMKIIYAPESEKSQTTCCIEYYQGLIARSPDPVNTKYFLEQIEGLKKMGQVGI